MGAALFPPCWALPASAAGPRAGLARKVLPCAPGAREELAGGLNSRNLVARAAAENLWGNLRRLETFPCTLRG